MPNTKNQFLRQEILVGLLSRNQLNRTELIDSMNDKLSEYDLGPVHPKTVYNDLKELVRLGAVIHFPVAGDNRYYFEERFNPDGGGLSEEDFGALENALQVLKGLPVFRVAREVAEILSRLKSTRNMINFNADTFIAFEDHTLAQGVERLDDLTEAIRNKTPLKIDYQPFYKEELTFTFFPYFLKEHRNRWFVLGRREDHNRLVVLALDRIRRIRPDFNVQFLVNDLFDPKVFFDSMIGVSLPTNAEPEKVRLRIFRQSAMHVETKMIHHSQELLSRNDDGSIDVELTVVVNYELISTILGFGAAVKVLGPEGVVGKITAEIIENLKQYALNQGD